MECQHADITDKIEASDVRLMELKCCEADNERLANENDALRKRIAVLERAIENFSETTGITPDYYISKAEKELEDKDV